jgi:hypothetical protein
VSGLFVIPHTRLCFRYFISHSNLSLIVFIPLEMIKYILRLLLFIIHNLITIRKKIVVELQVLYCSVLIATAVFSLIDRS